MGRKRATNRLRVPIEIVDGVWECAFGGVVPIKNRSRAELVVDRASIYDHAFLEAMQLKDQFKVLEEGAALLVCLTVKSIQHLPERHRSVLKAYINMRDAVATESFEMTFNPTTLFFVEVRLAAPDQKQLRHFGSEKGGLWLLTEGRQAVGLASASILLPPEVRKEAVSSLNHAYTILSETFEVSRISHTGNIYKQVLYKEGNGRWVPLGLLRDAALAHQDHKIANNLWRAFMAKMTSRTKA